jgi:hypothetical protein
VTGPRGPWLPGTVLQRVGPDEFQIGIEDLAVAVHQDGSRPTPRMPRRKPVLPDVLPGLQRDQAA